MSDYYIGQIIMVGFDFPPRNFALCNGQLLAIAQNQALFALLGTTYGGNGVTTFALPDLRGRTPIGGGFSSVGGGEPTTVLGQVGGTEAVTLLSTQIPPHVHTVNASTASGTTRNPNNAIYANTTTALHAPASSGSLVTLNPATLALAGGTQPHSNMQPYLGLNFCIAIFGIFPSRN